MRRCRDDFALYYMDNRGLAGTQAPVVARPDEAAVRTGHRSRAHAPDEYDVIDSGNPALHGMAAATLVYVKHLYAPASV